MSFARSFFTVAALVLTTASFADTTWFSGRDVVADFENFMGLSGDFSKTYQGKTEEGKTCSFKAVKTGKKIVITPSLPAHGPLLGKYMDHELAQSRSFIVTNDNKHLNGGFEGNKLWSSYFIDRDRGDLTLHGQFGVGSNIEMEKNNDGKLTKISYRKTRMEDLGYFPLGHLTCTLK